MPSEIMNKQFSKLGSAATNNGNGSSGVSSGGQPSGSHASHAPFAYNHNHAPHGNMMGEILDVDCSKDLNMFMSQIDSMMLNN